MPELLTTAAKYAIELLTARVMVIDVLCCAMTIWGIKTITAILRQRNPKVTGREKIKAATYNPKQFRKKRDEW